MKLKVKKLKNFVGELPKYESEGASGFDLRAMRPFEPYKDIKDLIYLDRPRLIPTGLCFEIPKGYELQIRSRSGLASKGIFVLNSPGTIDSDYRGEVSVLLLGIGERAYLNEGDRIAQAVLCPIVKAELEEVKELSETKRGDKGFGSSGNE